MLKIDLLKTKCACGCKSETRRGRKYAPGHYDLSMSGNPRWKGGTRLQRGYVSVKVPKAHHLANSYGYAMEHRMVAEMMLGRRLTASEVVHHRDGNKLNNDPSNLAILDALGNHRNTHRRGHRLWRAKGEPNPEVECGCGCGLRFQLYNKDGYPRRYVHGHYRRGMPGGLHLVRRNTECST